MAAKKKPGTRKADSNSLPEIFRGPTPRQMEQMAVDDLVRRAVETHPDVKKIERKVRGEIKRALREAKKSNP